MNDLPNIFIKYLFSKKSVNIKIKNIISFLNDTVNNIFKKIKGQKKINLSIKEKFQQFILWISSPLIKKRIKNLTLDKIAMINLGLIPKESLKSFFIFGKEPNVDMDNVGLKNKLIVFLSSIKIFRPPFEKIKNDLINLTAEQKTYLMNGHMDISIQQIIKNNLIKYGILKEKGNKIKSA